MISRCGEPLGPLAQATGMDLVNRQITLAGRPAGLPKESDFKLVETRLLAPGAGQFLVPTIYLPLDLYMHGWMSDRASYAPPVQLGAVMVGEGVGKVNWTDPSQ